MTTALFSPRQPDILEVIANLSNDEVFTPPPVASAVLDALPAEVWRDQSLRWLDPGCKTGVFPRAITTRLMAGLVDSIPDAQARLEHILKNMVCAIAITELTALMARRTLYCSKDAAGEHSAVAMPTSQGNVWFRRVKHSYANGRCTECGASAEQFEREGRENYAYGFVHKRGRMAFEKETGMKFDVIVGNPPYQMDASSGSRTMPIYNLFVDQAKALNPKYIAMIIPSRWMAGGLGLSEFRAEMLGDKRIRRLVDFPDAGEVFPGVEIKGGVCYFLWSRDEPGECDVTLVRGGTSHGPIARNLGEYDVLVRDSRALEILHKVQARKEPSIMDILAVDKEFGMTSNYSGYRRTKKPGTIKIYALSESKRVEGWISRKAISKSDHLVDTWKILIPQAYGAGDTLPHQILGQPLIAAPPSCCTQTYLFVYVDSRKAAESVYSYVRTRFFRFLISLRKLTQHATRSTYMWVPQQTWNHTWTDEELYKRYAFNREEQAYIAAMVKEMPA